MQRINQTLSRTILTSGLTFLTAFVCWLFGGPVLHGFSFASGGWNYRRDLFVGVHCQSDLVSWHELDGEAENGPRAAPAVQRHGAVAVRTRRRRSSSADWDRAWV